MESQNDSNNKLRLWSSLDRSHSLSLGRKENRRYQEDRDNEDEINQDDDCGNEP